MQSEDYRPRTPRPARQTLPRDFIFHYQDAAPRTPEPPKPQYIPEDVPQPLKLRIKRRRPQAESGSEFVPLPQIELSALETDFSSVLNVGVPELRDGFLAPTATSRSMKRYGRIIDNPKTPLDQVFNVFDAAYGNGGQWTPNAQVEPIARPASTFSDSSDSSSSSDSSPSFGDSCNSPDSDTAETFVFPQSAHSLHRLSSPLSFNSSQRSTRRIKPQHHYKWTGEMDEHIWQTYITYIGDPTVTPFKMLPGTAPPLGVCHRVARDAKKSWKGPRPSLNAIEEAQQGPYMSLDAALTHDPLTARTNALRSQLDFGNISTGDVTRRGFATWPRSEASTRKRLRELCKKKPTLSPHYQRLMVPRSPSSFDSSSSSKADTNSSAFTSPPSQSEELESVFSTREMNISLATSTAPSMQPDGPLSQLASDTLKPRPYSTEWSRPAARTGAAHQKSKSLHLSLGIGFGNHQINSFRKLNSPFHDIQPLPTMAEQTSPVEPGFPQPAMEPDVPQPRPLSMSMKRRAPIGEEAAADTAGNRRSFLEGLFRTAELDNQRRVRGRGFSVGGYRHSYTPQSRHLSEIFTPPPTNNNEGAADFGTLQAGTTPFNMAHNRISLADGDFLSPPYQAEHIRRLGSPFAPNANQRYSQTFPRAVFPHGLDAVSMREEPQTPSRKPLQGRTISESSLAPNSTLRRY